MFVDDGEENESNINVPLFHAIWKCVIDDSASFILDSPLMSSALNRTLMTIKLPT